ncbi:hypothetical protein SAMN05216532_7313 [Streptomyces sp. 2231.1]|uniref:hypothetical protein n=1 Tax=Streptomyces sp. 2231.1 TaxID=1855347 RepID=UPI00089D0ECF|nr:hypothetical protein [Streptomyces sp. 2231.1]SEE20201.1 hypothetical protein SAMN05216532_7313 [Streptomyces sp. 2231.1]
MRWWTLGGAVAAIVVVAGCGASSERGGQAGASAGGSARQPESASSAQRSSPPGPPVSPGVSVPGSSAVPGRCLAGRAELAVSPGDPVRRRLCVRPGTVVTLVLRPRVDDKRWERVRSSAPALVVASGWRLEADGTAHAALRSAGARGGEARVTVAARAPDVAGAARPVFTMDVRVVPYPREG